MILGVGSDIIEVSRIEKSIQRYQKKFLDRIFTENEQSYCLRHKDAQRHFAGRFAAKEAIVKALGTGISKSISWLDIEISNDPLGKPLVTFSSHVKEEFHDPSIHISISHCKEYAVAFAVWS
jgi:holo-[acyl-carrier protein] synthase